MAKHYGATVTGVCSTTNLALVKSLGADEVIDYTRSDFTENDQTYDVIFDTVGKTSFSHCKASLTEEGIFLEAAAKFGILFQMAWTSKFSKKKAKIAFAGLRSPMERTKDLRMVKELIEAGEIKSTIDRCFPLEQMADAHVYVGKGHKKGNVVITV